MKWDHESALRDVESGRAEGPQAAYRELLGKCPVAHLVVNGNVDYVGIFGYEELVAAAADVKTFSNVTPLRGPRILPLQSDPPEHASFRRLMNRFFTAERVATEEPTIRRFAGEMVESMVTRGTADFATEFAYPLPTRILCHFVGIPDRDWKLHHEFITDLERRTGHGLNSPDESITGPAAEMMAYLFGLIAERRAHPGDDVLSGIIGSEIDGRPLDDGTVAGLALAILMAGHITSTSAVGNIALRLARDPELQSFLRANPTRIPDAIEESLRLDTPQQAMPRRCLHAMTVAGEEIAAGANVILNFGSANVDPRHFPEPETFDLDRADKRHLAFGRGVHQCVGAALARLDLRVVVEELLSRTSSFVLAGTPRRFAWPRLSVEEMPVTFVGRAVG